MTAADFAEVLHARRAGAGKWSARCPAHPDRSPSLSIQEGRDGRVLVHCFAGCEPADVLSALGLTWKDVCGSPMSPEDARQAARLREQREAAQRKERRARRDAWDKVRKLEAVVNALGAKLARMPDDSPEGDALTRMFHDACMRGAEAEMAALAASEAEEAA